ncbi:MAG: beta-lactamase family protein [Burkholderiales bacterium]|nr:beta-lactamase family protein [Burkholderiales bacterium]
MADKQTNRRDFLSLGGALALGAVASATLSACGSAGAAENDIWSASGLTQATASGPGGAVITGRYAAAFKPVWDQFVANFQSGGEIGASVAITHNGQSVLDAWGGFADALSPTPSAAWNRDTISLVFSCTKGATALCAHMLVAEGLLDLDKPVAHYWPEFAANGKAGVKVRHLLQHSSGVAAIGFENPVPPGGWADWNLMTSLLAAQAPWWEPGTAHGYHALTFGWLVGEVVRRVSGQSLGIFFKTRVAQPLGLDFAIGLPADQHSRVAPMLPTSETIPGDPFLPKLMDPTSMQAALFFNLGGWLGLPPSTPPAYNSAQSLQAEIPAAGGVANARSLATMYGLLANGGALGSTRLLPVAYAAQVGLVRSAGLDRSLLLDTRWAQGYHGSIDNRKVGPSLSTILGANAFGHAGFGGSIGFADPGARMSFGYTMNRMGAGTGLNSRGQSLVNAAYHALGATTDQWGAWT